MFLERVIALIDSVEAISHGIRHSEAHRPLSSISFYGRLVSPGSTFVEFGKFRLRWGLVLVARCWWKVQSFEHRRQPLESVLSVRMIFALSPHCCGMNSLKYGLGFVVLLFHINYASKIMKGTQCVVVFRP